MGDKGNVFRRIGRFLPRGWGDLVLQVGLVFAGYVVYSLVRGLVDNPQTAAAAFENGRTVISVQQDLGIFVEPRIQAAFGGTGLVADVASWIYLNAQLSVTFAALVWIYFRHNRSFYFVRNTFMVAWLLALVVYIVMPVAPPRFFPEFGFVDSVSAFTGVSSETSNALFNPYAAIPSMHVAFSLMIGVPLAILVRHRPVKAFWAVYPLLVTFVIIVTGNHFIADAILGAVAAGIAAVGATWMGRLRPEWSFRGAETADGALPARVQA